jgi:hypothetical protein
LPLVVTYREPAGFGLRARISTDKIYRLGNPVMPESNDCVDFGQHWGSNFGGWGEQAGAEKSAGFAG